MKKGLGRGLDSLFGSYDDELLNENIAIATNSESKKGEVKENETHAESSGAPVEIDIGLIDRNPSQPRTSFDEESLSELAASIKSHGIIQPIIVKKQDDRFVIIAGERRWRASRLAGLKTIPCLIREYSQQEMSEIAIIENLQRENLNPIESARAIKNLIDNYNLTQEEVADKIGKSRPVIANTLRLLLLPDQIIALVETGKISAGHARALLGVNDPLKQKQIALQIIEKNLNVRDVENLVKFANLPDNSTKNATKKQKSLELKDFEQKLKRVLATKVEIKGDEAKGKIVVNYYSLDDLNRIYDLLNK